MAVVSVLHLPRSSLWRWSSRSSRPLPSNPSRNRPMPRKPSLRRRAPSRGKRGTTSASSATRSPSGCSTTAGSKPSSTPASRNHDLTIRNLGFSGDEINLRLRSQDFGTPDQWLAGDAPIPQARTRSPTRAWCNPNRFEKAEHEGRRDLRLLRLQRVVRRRGRPAEVQGRPRPRSSSTRWRRSTTASPRRGSCCSRRSRSRTTSRRTCPTVEEINKNLELYTNAMGEVAKANGVHFVDLYRPDVAGVPRSRRNR